MLQLELNVAMTLLVVSSHYSIPELAKYNAAAEAPERDNAVVTPESDRRLEDP